MTSGDDLTTEITQPQVILSINSYSDIEIEVIERAREVYHYFRHKNDLPDLNYVVVDIQDINNRTVLITDHYEYRYGFDVWIRYKDEIVKENYTIEDWSVNVEL